MAEIEVDSPEKAKMITGDTEFSTAAERYLKNTPREKQLQLLEKYFVGVRLGENQKKFLEKDWAYIYTLNIDDGIEGYLKDYKAILPYKRLNHDYLKTKKCIFKLHGDAEHEVTYPDDENIVLSRKQYWKSIRDNIDLRTLIQSDYKTKSILIIGCSFDDEIDLEYAVSTNDGFDESRNYRFYLTTDKEIDPEHEEKLQNLFVNRIIHVDSYADFYCTFLEGVKKNENILEAYHFVGYQLDDEKEANIDYFLGLRKQENGKKIVKYKAMAERDVEINKIDAILQNNTILVVGPRVSGKTTFLVNLMQKLASYEVYFFSSVITVSAEFMDEICALRNAVLVFDSNAISPDNVKEFENIFRSVKSNDNKLIVAANKSDKLFMAFYTNLYFDVKVEIDKRPSPIERKKINDLINPFAIPRIGETSFIDNIAELSTTIFKGRKNTFPSISLDSVDETELTILILLASVGKVYYLTFQSLDISVSEVERIVKKYEPVIELYDSDLIEIHMHSGLKVVANSKYWIIDFLSAYAKRNVNKIADVVEHIVKALYFSQGSSYCAKQVILFDNINAIFALKGGVVFLAFKIYEQLQAYLNDVPDYWLQRAKSIRILSTKIDELLLSREYAYKAYSDINSNSKYSEKAVLTLAMILGKICKLENYKNRDRVKEAIDFYYEALCSEANVIYVNDMLANARMYKRENDFYCLADYLSRNSDLALSKVKVSKILTSCYFN